MILSFCVLFCVLFWSPCLLCHLFPCISCPCDFLPCSWLFPPVWLLAPPSLCPPVSRSPVSNHLHLPCVFKPLFVVAYGLCCVCVFDLFLVKDYSFWWSVVGIWVLSLSGYSSNPDTICTKCDLFHDVSASNIQRELLSGWTWFPDFIQADDE